MNVFANSNDRAELARITQAWLGYERHNQETDKPIFVELQRLGILTPEEGGRMFIEHQCVEHGLIAICDFNTCDADSIWLQVSPDGTCSA